MKKYAGMNFKKWCSLDEEDTKKINYTLKGTWEGEHHIEYFTSEEDVDYMMMYRIQNSVIESIQLINSEWNVVLIY